MSEAAKRYARALFALKQDRAGLAAGVKLVTDRPELYSALCNPTVSAADKVRLVDTVLIGVDEVFLHFFKLLCQNARMPQLPEIAREYDTLCLEREGGIRARLCYAVKPTEAGLERIKQAVCKKYHKTSVAMRLEEDPTLLGGFVLYVGNTRYDNSLKTRLAGLQSNLQAR